MTTPMLYSLKHKSMAIDSKRSFEIFIAEAGTSQVVTENIHSLLDPKDFGDDYEYKYAAQEITDEILDLKVGESMYFQPNRDDKNSKGIIIRTK